MTQWRKREWWGLGGVALVWLLGWLAMPALLRWQLEQQASAYLGRAVRVEGVSVQPWSLAVQVQGVQVSAVDPGAQPVFRVERVVLNASLASVLRWAPVLESVRVQAPRLQLQHLGQGRYDVDDLLQKWMQPSPEDAAIPRFSLADLQIEAGEVALTDHSAAGAPTYRVQDIQLALPFVSSLPSQVEREVVPRLTFRVQDSQFDSAAHATPFAAQPKGTLQLRWQGLDLGAYRQYWPAVLPVRLHSAVLDADLSARFAADPAGLEVSGAIALRGVSLRDERQIEVLGWERLQVQVQMLDPLRRNVAVQRLEWDAPRVRVARDAAGRIQPWQSGSEIAINNVATNSTGTSGSGKNDAKNVESPWTLTLQELAVQGGSLQWTDASTEAPAQIALAGVQVQASALQWPAKGVDAAVTARGTLGGGSKAQARWELQAQGGPQAGQAQWQLHDAALSLVRPYLARWLVPTLDASVQAKGNVQWKDGVPQTVTLEQLSLGEMALRDGALALAQMRELQVRQARIDLAQRRVQVAALQLRQPQLRIERGADGSWQALQWLRAPAVPAPTKAEAASGGVPDWDVRLQELRVDGASLGWLDATTPTPVQLQFSALALQMQGVGLSGQSMPLQLDARVAAGQVEPGRVHFKGQAGWAPALHAQGSLLLEDVPVHALVPYVAERLALDILRAEANFDGQLRYQAGAEGPQLEVQGDAVVEDFIAHSVSANDKRDELLRWKALTVPGVRLSMAPQQPLRLGVRELTLNDFYARLIVNAQGRLNLQDIVKPAPLAAGAEAPVAAVPAQPAAPELAPDIDIGPVTLAQGRVLFTDRFIQPNYTADLTELNGRLSRFTSRAVDGSVQMAQLELRGRAEGTATLFVGGKVNPLAQPLVLDVQGKVRDLELPPLSPYAVKYAGYGIERGKLNVDVGYKVSADGRLEASNNIVLKQLQFGDKVEGAQQTLPVKLATALLADQNGVIDIDLPISGSLSDPQFKIGAVVWKVITNLLTKVVTAPFKLLAGVFSAGGDGVENASIAFESGQAQLGDAARSTLDALAQAMLKRPGVQLTVQGSANWAVERVAMQRQRLREMLLAEKRRRTAAEGGDATQVKSVQEGEAPRLLAQVYKRADIKKPRNMVGLAKDLSDAEMEQLLMDSIAISEEAVRELALQRAVAVKDHLVAAQLPVERVFLGATQTSGQDETWSPRAELTLGM